MRDYIFMLLLCSVTMSAVALIYMAVTPILAKYYSEKWRYYAWLIIVAGLIVPFRPQFESAIVKLEIEKPAAIIETAGFVEFIENAEITVVPPGFPYITWWQTAMFIWISGMIIFCGYRMIKHLRFVNIVKRWSKNTPGEYILELFENLKSEMSITRKIELKICPVIYSPILAGLFKPRIFLPETNLTEHELRFILKHELVHYKRKDLLYKYLLFIATAVHWFNPLVYMIARAASAQCEKACDDAVIGDADFTVRKRYALMILDLAKTQSKVQTALITNFYGDKYNMENRLLSIMDTSRKKTGLIILCCMLAATLSMSFIFAVTAYTPEEPLLDLPGFYDMPEEPLLNLSENIDDMPEDSIENNFTLDDDMMKYLTQVILNGDGDVTLHLERTEGDCDDIICIVVVKKDMDGNPIEPNMFYYKERIT